jgi:hypothetical protein
MGSCQSVVDLKCSSCRGTSLFHYFCSRQNVKFCGTHHAIGIGKAGLSRGVTRLLFGGFLEIAECFLRSLWVSLVPEVAASQIKIVCLPPDSWRACQPQFLRWTQMDLNLSSDRACNLKPRRGTVSMKRGLSAESPSTSRRRFRLTAARSAWSPINPRSIAPSPHPMAAEASPTFQGGFHPLFYIINR